MPRTFVNFVTVLNVAELEDLHEGFVCQGMQGYALNYKTKFTSAWLNTFSFKIDCYVIVLLIQTHSNKFELLISNIKTQQTF